MIVAIAGGHGQVALQLAEELARRDHEPVGLVRNADHLPDLAKRGARGEVVDLEHTTVEALAAAIAGADVVVFAAGAGPGSGPARKDSLDRDGAVLLADAAEQSGVIRYVMVSAIDADRADPESDDVYQVYLRAKAAADRDLRGRDALAWTIVRPGRLTDDDPTGQVDLSPAGSGSAGSAGSVPRGDVAAVLAELITSGRGVGQQLDLVAGRVPVAEAVASLGQ